MVKYEKVTLTNMKKKAKCEKWRSHILQRTFLKDSLGMDQIVFLELISDLFKIIAF